MDKKVIAVVGPIASGKGTLITLLEAKGYIKISLSDIVRTKTHEWGLELTRKNLQDVGDKLRKSFGPSFLAEMVVHTITQNPEKKYVIDSVRNPAEVAYLQKHLHAFVIGITASPQKRFELMKKRASEWDPKTWEEFVKSEERDRGIGQESYGQQVEKCLQMANIVVDNNGSLTDFTTNLSYFLDKVLDGEKK